MKKKECPCKSCLSYGKNCTCDDLIEWRYGKNKLKAKDKEPKT
jgi:hypothetical protein